MAADLIFAEANEAQDVKKGIQELMNRDEDDDVELQLFSLSLSLGLSSYKRLLWRGLVTYSFWLE